MKEHIDLFDRSSMNIREVIEKGIRSKTLRENTAFSEAVKDIYWKLTLAEDKVMADFSIDGRKASEEIKRIANMRAVLADLVLILDGNILEGENAQHEQENIDE